MKILKVILIIFNILCINGLEYQHLQPGVVVEIFGKLGMIDDYFHVAFRVNFSGFHLNEIANLQTSAMKLYSEINPKLKDKFNICMDKLDNFHQNIKDKSNELLKSIANKDQLYSNLCKLSNLNVLKDGEQDQNIEKNATNLVVVDFTNDILPNIYEDATSLTKSFHTLKDLVAAMENDIEPVDEKINQHFEILEKFMETYDTYLSEVQTIINHAQNFKVNSRLLKNISLKDVLEGKIITNDAQHIINLNTINAENVENVGPTIGPFKMQSLIKASVYKEDNIPYIIISLPLTKEKNFNNLQLVQLKPLPRLKDRTLIFIKTKTNFFINNVLHDRGNYIVNDLSCCYKYNENYFCDYNNNTETSSQPCVTNIIKYGYSDFCEIYKCKYSILENFGANIIEFHKKYSYLVVTEKPLSTVYTGGSFKNMKLEIPVGVSLLYSGISISLKINEMELKFDKENSGDELLPNDYEYVYYDIITQKFDEMIEIPEIDMTKARSFSPMNIVTVDTIYNLSSDLILKQKNRKLEDENTKIVPENEPVYIVLIKILVTGICLTALLLLFFKYVLKYNLIMNLRLKEGQEPLKENQEEK